jgi:poly(A) polymerase
MSNELILLNKMTTIDIFKLIIKVAGANKVYIIGGWLRDKLLKKQNRDLDIVCSCDPGKFASKIAKLLKGSLVKLDDENKIYRVVLKNNPELDCIDFAKLKGKDIASDLKKRDFTINSFALEISAGTVMTLSTHPSSLITRHYSLIDPLKGLVDLRKKLIRASSNEAFTDDPLRMLRCFRLAAELGFVITPDTRKLVVKNSDLISKPAKERVRDELIKILSAGPSLLWVKELDRTKLLEHIIPEINAMKRSARSFYFHPLGLWQHAMETLRGFENITKKPSKYFPGHVKDFEAYLSQRISPGITRETLLKLCCLLHDVAKPLCATRSGNKTRFIGHDIEGAKLVAKIFERLRLGNKEIKAARLIVSHHMRPVSLGQNGTVSERAIFRLFRDLGDEVVDLLLLSLSDWHSYKSLKSKMTRNIKCQEHVVNKLVARYFDQQKKPSAPKIIDGNILLEKLGLKPGPIIGALLKMIEEARALGKIKTTEQALTFAASNLTNLKKKYKITSEERKIPRA